MLASNNGVALDYDVFMQQPQAALSGIGRGCIQVFINGSLCEWDAVGVAIGD
jgi:hypothetical protein